MDKLKAQQIRNIAGWYAGDLRHLLCDVPIWNYHYDGTNPSGQLQVYDWVHEWREKNPEDVGPLVIELGRGRGKTHVCRIMDVEQGLQKPGQQIRVAVAESMEQAIKVIKPIMDNILMTCPFPECFHYKDNVLFFRNPRWKKNEPDSQLIPIGCRNYAKTERGPRSDRTNVDEAAFIDNYDYVTKDVLGGQFQSRLNPLMIIISTPPESMDHGFLRDVEAAQRQGRYLLVSGDKDPSYNEKEKKKAIAMYGEPGSNRYEREINCAHIALAGTKVIEEDVNYVISPHKRPLYDGKLDAIPLVCGDLGYEDYNAFLFGYWDFQSNLLIIEDEGISHQVNTKVLAEQLKAIEARLEFEIPERRCDNDPQEVADLTQIWGYQIVAIKKTKRWLWTCINRMRAMIQERQIRIHPRCETLIYQLKNATRDDKGNLNRSSKRFEPGETQIMGHCDALVALAYMCHIYYEYKDVNPRTRMGNLLQANFKELTFKPYGTPEYKPLNLNNII